MASWYRLGLGVASCSGSCGLRPSLPVSGRNSRCFCSQQRAPGRALLDAVCSRLNLVEGDYFGLEFPDHKKITVGDVHWDVAVLPSVRLGGREVMGTFLGHTEVYNRKCTQKALDDLFLKVTCAYD